MARRPERSSPAEQRVLEALWEHGEATVRELDARLRAGGRRWAYTTLLTLLTRLEAKGLARSRRAGQARVFRAALSRDELIGRRLAQLTDELCGGATSPLVQALVEGRRLAPDDVERLRSLVERLDREREEGA